MAAALTDETVVHEVVGPSLSRREAAAVIFLGVIALDIVGVAAVLLGAFQDEHRLSAAGIGVTAMLELVSMGLVTGLCGAFLKAGRLRIIGAVACVAVAILDVAGVATSGTGLILTRALAGAPEGVLIWITVGMISRSQTPERWAAVYFTGQVLAQLVLAALFWLIVLPRFGANGGLWTLGLTSLIGVPVAFFAPTAYGALTQSDGLSGAPPPRGWAALVATVVFTLANGAVSVYLQPLGHQAGLSAAVVRFAVVASLVAQVGGGTLATVLAGKVRYITVFAVAVVLYLGVWAVYAVNASAWLFVAVTALSGAVSLMVGPFLTPMTIAADPSRRTAMQSAGAQIFGGALGPLIASFLVSDADVRGVLVLAAVGLLIGFVMMLAIHLTTKKP